MWTRDNIEEFIEIYKSLPCLWKVKSEDYKNKGLKNQAYQKLVNYCRKEIYPNANRDFVIKKIQGMRGSFRKELKKVKQSQKSDNCKDSVYKPTLWYYDLLLFTKYQDDPADSASSNDDTDEDDLMDHEFELAPKADMCVEDLSSENEKARETANTSANRQSSNKDSKHKRVFAVPKASRKKATGFEATATFMDVFQRALEKSCAEVTEFEAVGINVAKKLGRMNPSQAIYAENLISTVLCRGLLNQLNSNMTAVAADRKNYSTTS